MSSRKSKGKGRKKRQPSGEYGPRGEYAARFTQIGRELGVTKQRAYAIYRSAISKLNVAFQANTATKAQQEDICKHAAETHREAR